MNEIENVQAFLEDMAELHNEDVEKLRTLKQTNKKYPRMIPRGQFLVTDMKESLWKVACPASAETYPTITDILEGTTEEEQEIYLNSYKEGLIKLILFLENLNPMDLKEGSSEKFQERQKELKKYGLAELQVTTEQLIETDKRKKREEKKDIELSGNNRTNKTFARELAYKLEGTEIMFHKQNENIIIEIAEFTDKELNKELVGFQEIKPTRLINIIENIVTCYKIEYINNQPIRKDKTPPKGLAEYLLENDDIKNSLQKIKRLLKNRMTFIIENKLVLPTIGYNENIQAYVTKDSPEIKELSLEEAKNIILELFEDFCFKEEIDKTMAIAGFLTPACRGLYETRTARTPIFLYIANRERAGKDYLAGITGITYEGNNIENPPVTDNDKNSNGNAELRKKITSFLKSGQRRFHSSNNKGRIDNAVLEQITTTEHWQDRILGSNNDLTLPNEMDFSLSANVGISWSPDFWNRCRPVNLFLDIENPNERIFQKPNLHNYINKNRSRIQSAIITIIKEWYEAGQPPGNTFSSFPEWARVVGGIMNFCEFGDPTTPLQDDSDIGGDTETINFRELFKLMNEIQTKTLQKMHTIREITEFIKAVQLEGNDIFSYYDFEKNSDKMKFGKVFKKYLGRIFSDIKLKIAIPNAVSQRVTYSFIKEVKSLYTLYTSATSRIDCAMNSEKKHKGIGKSIQSIQSIQSSQNNDLSITEEMMTEE